MVNHIIDVLLETAIEVSAGQSTGNNVQQRRGLHLDLCNLDYSLFHLKNPDADVYCTSTMLNQFKSLISCACQQLDIRPKRFTWDCGLNSIKHLLYSIDDSCQRERYLEIAFNSIRKHAGIPPTSTATFHSLCYTLVSELAESIPEIADNIRKELLLPQKNQKPRRHAAGVMGAEPAEGEVFGKQCAIIMEERILTYTTELPPWGEMDLWHYDNHLLRISGPPVDWFYIEGEEPKRDPVTDEERIGTIKLKKRLMVEIWENDAEPDTVEGEEGEEGEESKEEAPETLAAQRDSEVRCVARRAVVLLRLFSICVFLYVSACIPKPESLHASMRMQLCCLYCLLPHPWHRARLTCRMLHCRAGLGASGVRVPAAAQRRGVRALGVHVGAHGSAQRRGRPADPRHCAGGDRAQLRRGRGDPDADQRG